MQNKYALEHFPVNQAQQIVNDIEALLIFKYKPYFNTHHKEREKRYNKPFQIKEIIFL